MKTRLGRRELEEGVSHKLASTAATVLIPGGQCPAEPDPSLDHPRQGLSWILGGMKGKGPSKWENRRTRSASSCGLGHPMNPWEGVTENQAAYYQEGLVYHAWDTHDHLLLPRAIPGHCDHGPPGSQRDFINVRFHHCNGETVLGSPYAPSVVTRAHGRGRQCLRTRDRIGEAETGMRRRCEDRCDAMDPEGAGRCSTAQVVSSNCSRPGHDSLPQSL